jgi:O-antigen/teichoic acid export membrane protein
MLEQYAFMALSLAVFVPSLLSSLALFVLANRSAPYVLFSPRTVGIQPLRELLGISLAAMVVTLAAVLLRQGSGILAGYSLGLDSVALIALPVMLVGSVGPFLGIANKLISPIASQLDATQRVDELRMVYLTAVRHTLASGLLIYVCMIFFAPYLLPLWLGGQSLEPEYVRSIYLNLLLIFGGYCLAIPAFLARAVLVSVGRHKIAARGELISSLVGLVIGYMLMEALEIGVAGMACGIAAAYLIRASGVLVRQLALYFEMSLFHLFVEVWRLPLLTSVPLVLVFIPQLIGNQDFGAAALFGLLALGLWGWLVLRLIITESSREKLFRILRKMGLGKANF